MHTLIKGVRTTDPSTTPAQLDLLLVNAPLRDYSLRPRVNDYTLPVLGTAYIATYAASQGFTVGVLDAEAAGLPIADTVSLINQSAPRWAGFNLLAPTYEISADIVAALDPHIRVVELLADHRNRTGLPGVMWRDPVLGTPVSGGRPGTGYHLAPDIDALPFVDRGYLVHDPYRAEDDRIEANMVGARGCPYDCSFCGAAVSVNPDVTIRVREPSGILGEMHRLRDDQGVTAFRFVDDLFLGARRVIDRMTAAFAAEKVSEWAVWDATGRINVLHRVPDETLDLLAACGLREVALGIESGSERMLAYIDKRITQEMILSVVQRLTIRGIKVKGYRSAG
ncbi:radical SAM protein [Streptosporangium sp. NPDC006007]|uniref:B12-binding domain-containing radical SAM protein n=1 Tax=Streptosporangium sp. NPDC006007 TaxID=3154575 RepID=UPI0033AE425F